MSLHIRQSRDPALTAYQKQFELKAAGVEITPEILAKVNQYTLKELTAEDIYVRKFIMAHNAVDRDNERFSELILEDFSKTLPGKSFLIGHDRSGPGIGLYFDAVTEEISPEQFISLTGETPRLPDGIEKVKILWGWVYLVKAAFNEEMITNMDAGIYRHASIGFRASDLSPVKGPYDNILYWEYLSPGESLEGSIVWLGAQPGATSQKNHNGSFEPSKKGKGGKRMKELIKKLSDLFPGKSFTEEGLEEEIETAIDEKFNEAVEKTKIPLEARIKELEPLAEEGRAYREDLVKNYIAMKAKLGEVDETPEAQEKVRKVVEGYPIDFLKNEVKSLEKRVIEKFPADPQTKGDDRRDKSDDGKGGKKNPLIPEEEE